MEKHRMRFWTEKERASTHPGPTQIWKTASLLNMEVGFGSEMMKVSGVSVGFDRYGSRGSDGGSGFPLKSLGDRNFWPSDFRTKVYRVPPPENATRYKNYTRQNPRRSSCRCCFCWLFGLVAALIFLSAAAAGIFYFTVVSTASLHSGLARSTGCKIPNGGCTDGV
ncbi:hypothetical protein ACFX13_024623 [Malus domestica]